MSAAIYDERVCELGEGPIWSPDHGRYFWADILGRRLLWRGPAGAGERRLDRMASAFGLTTRPGRLLLATETGLALLDPDAPEEPEPLAAIEADRPETRSNDGRADRQGGFWIGTMGKRAEPGAGSIYRHFKGETRRIVEGLAIPNAICFSPDGRLAHYADSRARLVWSQPLDAEGWPQGERRVFLDLRAEGLNPDGAVIDSEGGFCCAKWGAGKVMRYGPDGTRTHELAVGALHCSCPAFGGEDLAEMLVTSALEGLESPDAAQGLAYLLRPGLKGLPEPRVIL